MHFRGAALLFTLFAVAPPVGISGDAEPGSARIIQYIHDGEQTMTRVMITSFGGPVFASVTTASAGDSREFMLEMDPALFERIWTGFDTIELLKNSNTTESTGPDDTETHHVFFTQEESTDGSKGRSFSVAASDATPEFLEWLKLFLPNEDATKSPGQTAPAG